MSPWPKGRPFSEKQLQAMAEASRQRIGKSHVGVPWYGRTLEDRLMAKVSPEPNSGCWLWGGAVDESGYGMFMLRKRSARAHRVAYEIFSGVEIPAHLQADHRCRVRSCVNPAHLELVTPQVNVARGQVGSNMRRRTHCPSGHPYDAQNTAHRNGRRHCRACDIARTRSRVV